jgi:SAM-dependent methyltransferase
MKFEDIIHLNEIYLYLGDLSIQRRQFTNKNFIGLSLTTSNQYHIQHDVTNPLPLKDNTVDIVQSEDVMEHIEYDNLKDSINEIYRILKPGGLFRLSMPDYNCDILYNRSRKDEHGNLIFDAGGGGSYDEYNKKVVHGGHVWFPKFNSVKLLLESTNFLNNKINYLHYYDNDNNPVTHKIDYSKGYISRTPDNDDRVKHPYRPMSIVVDCYK